MILLLRRKNWPEMKLFAESGSLNDLDAVWERLEAKLTSRASLWFVFMLVLFLCFGGMIVSVELLAQKTGLSRVVGFLVGIPAATGLCIWAIFATHSRSLRKMLREEADAAGIPVCRHCGFDLRGFIDKTKCPRPTCGAALNVPNQRMWLELHQQTLDLDEPETVLTFEQWGAFLAGEDSADFQRVGNTVLVRCFEADYGAVRFCVETDCRVPVLRTQFEQPVYDTMVPVERFAQFEAAPELARRALEYFRVLARIDLPGVKREPAPSQGQFQILGSNFPEDSIAVVRSVSRDELLVELRC